MSPQAKFYVDPTEYAGKRALVTGGTEGVGAAIVSRLAAGGARVATTARSKNPTHGASDLYVQADVSKADGVREVARALLDRYGGPDLPRHNGGRSSAPAGGFGSLTAEEWLGRPP